MSWLGIAFVSINCNYVVVFVSINYFTVFSGEFSTVGHWTMNVGDDNVIVLDDLSVVEPPLALKQNKQILKVQTVTVKHNI